MRSPRSIVLRTKYCITHWYYDILIEQTDVLIYTLWWRGPMLFRALAGLFDDVHISGGVRYVGPTQFAQADAALADAAGDDDYRDRPLPSDLADPAGTAISGRHDAYRWHYVGQHPLKAVAFLPARDGACAAARGSAFKGRISERPR
jgi:hypothetical protein